MATNRNAAADRVASILTRIEPAPEDAGRSEDEIMEDVLADIASARKDRHDRKAVAVEDLSNAEIEAIRRTAPPAEAEQHDHEITAAYGSKEDTPVATTAAERTG